MMSACSPSFLALRNSYPRQTQLVGRALLMLKNGIAIVVLLPFSPPAKPPADRPTLAGSCTSS